MNIFLLTIAVITSLALGGFVLSQNSHNSTNRLFFILTNTAAIWAIVNFLSTHQLSASSTLMYARWELFCAVLYSLAAFLTVHTFPSHRLRLPLTKVIPLLITSAIIAALTLTPLVFKALEGFGTSVRVTPGPAIPLFAALNIFLIAGSIITLVNRIKLSKGNKRTQQQFLLFGVLVSNLAAFITNFILVNIFKITELLLIGPYFPLLFSLLTGYAIIAHHLFDVRVFIKRTVVYSGLLLITLASYSTIVFIFASLLGGHLVFTSQVFLTNLIAAFLISMGFDPLRKWLQEKTDQFLFKKEYEQQTVLKELGDRLNNVVDLDEALENVMRTIVKVLHLKHAATYVFQQASNNQVAIKRIKQIGYHSTQNLLFDESSPVISYLSQQPSTLLTQKVETELDKTLPTDPSHTILEAVLKKLNTLKVEVAVPLHINQQPVGLLFLSNKLSQENFTTQDLALIELVGAQAISSIQKAKLYEGDQMKTEFVSIASHELLTPISAIEGYLSMILDEHIGSIDGRTREYLNKVYASAKRLSLLIKDLLSVSRIESGKMKIEPQFLSIEKMIKEAIDQLKFVAQGKGLSLKFLSPKQSLPPVWADADRTMQVLINLISNAIKYSLKGEVEVMAELGEDGKQIIVSVKDTGIGMTKEQQTHLFEKFYRIDSPETAGIIGTGLGLYITRSIVLKMGGTISAKSTPGKGSTFCFSLPLFKVELSKL